MSLHVFKINDEGGFGGTSAYVILDEVGSESEKKKINNKFRLLLACVITMLIIMFIINICVIFIICIIIFIIIIISIIILF